MEKTGLETNSAVHRSDPFFVRSVCGDDSFGLFGLRLQPHLCWDLPYRTQNLCLKKVCVDLCLGSDRDLISFQYGVFPLFCLHQENILWCEVTVFSCRSRAAETARVLHILPSGSCSFLDHRRTFSGVSSFVFVFGGVLFCLIRVYQMKAGLAIGKAHKFSAKFLYICYHSMDFSCTHVHMYNVLSNYFSSFWALFHVKSSGILAQKNPPQRRPPKKRGPHAADRVFMYAANAQLTPEP